MGLGSMNSKDATLELKLSADSGYESRSEYRISAYEWGDVVALCEGSERGKKMSAGPALYEALKAMILFAEDGEAHDEGSYDSDCSVCAELKVARAALASAEGK